MSNALFFLMTSRNVLRRTFSRLKVYVSQTWSLVHVEPSYLCDADTRLLTFQLRTLLIPLPDADVAALPLPHLEASSGRVICNLAVRPNQSLQTADCFRFNRVLVQVDQFTPLPVDGVGK